MSLTQDSHNLKNRLAEVIQQHAGLLDQLQVSCHRQNLQRLLVMTSLCNAVAAVAAFSMSLSTLLMHMYTYTYKKCCIGVFHADYSAF